MHFLLCLLITSICLAAKPDEVLHVVNDASTLDTDENGVYDFQDCLNWWYSIYGDTSNVVRISTSIDYTTADNAQVVHWDKFAEGFDRSAVWGQDDIVSLGEGKEYILEPICEWFEADSTKRWGYVKYPILWMGFPMGLRSNDNVSGLPGGADDTTLCKSMPSALLLHVRPGCDGANPTDLSEWLSGRWTHSIGIEASQGRKVRFNPGIDWVAGRWDLGNTALIDTLRVWVLPTVMDADSVTYLRRALSKSIESPIINSAAKPRSWYVVDETESPSTDNIYSSNSTYKNNVARLFQTRVLCDADCVSSAERETTYLGWTDNPTLRSGDSCLVFFNSGDTHTPTPDSSENWYRQLTFPIATGAITWSSESYFGYSTRGYIRPTGTQTQSATSDALKVGFTYVLGNKHEPTSSGLVKDASLGHCLNQKDLPFAELAWACQQFGYHEFLPIGNPIGIINKGESQANWNSWRRW